MGYNQNDKRQHFTGCATVMDFQPASIIKTGEAGLRAAANIPVQYNTTGEAGLCAVADMEPVPYQTAEKDRLYAYAGIRR